MSELKHKLMLNKERSWVPCYLKSEADKVIADLEESHKKEFEQLLIEIAEKDKEIARLNDKALQYKVLDKEHIWYRRQKALPIFEAYLQSELERFKLEQKLEEAK